MAHQDETQNLSLLDEETRHRYMKAKAAQSTTVTSTKQTMPMMDGAPARSQDDSMALSRVYSLIDAGQVEDVKSVLQDKARQPQPEYLSKALSRAITSDQLLITQLLIDHGTVMGRNCLYDAAASASPAVVDLLINQGAKLEESTPLHAAVRRGKDSIPMLQHLLKLGANINGWADPFDQFSAGTPLQSILRNDPRGIRDRGESLRIVEFLLANGADPNPGGSIGIDAIEEPIKSELQVVIHQYVFEGSTLAEGLQSPASSTTLV